MVGSTITMLLDGLNDDLKLANERCDWMPAVASADGREQAIHQVAVNPLFFALSRGGPDVKDSAGNNWTAVFIDANGDPTVDLRSNLAAESRAKIVYEYLKQFTDDPSVQDTLTFLMTREIAHYQQFTAALNELPVNFPPGTLAGDIASRTWLQYVQRRRRIRSRAVESRSRTLAGGHAVEIRAEAPGAVAGHQTA